MKVNDILVMINCTKKLTYFVCSFCLIHKGKRKNKKKKILFRIRKNKKFTQKKGNLLDLHASLNEWELQKVKSFQRESVFIMILVKLFHR